MNILEGIWDVIWFFFWTFAFLAYLMAIFSIIADLFRDKELGGLGKALWLLFLIFVPFVTAVVYLIARGAGMGERAERDNQRAREYQEARIRSIAGTSSTDEIAKAKALLDNGTITTEEYSALKVKALS